MHDPLAIICRACGDPTEIDVLADARLCPSCAADPLTARTLVEERLIACEEQLVAAYARFTEILEAGFFEDCVRYDALLDARSAARRASDPDAWPKHLRREQKTIDLADGLSKILVAEREMAAERDRIAGEYEYHNDTHFDLDMLTKGAAWDIPPGLVERRRRLYAGDVPGRPQLVGVEVLDPRPTIAPVEKKPHGPCSYCQQPIRWTQVDGRPTPMNMDGTRHRTTCKGKARAAA